MSNAVPAHSYYGKPQGEYRLAHIEGARLASASAPYVGRGNKCSGNEDTCEGIRAKGTEFCMGHLRKLAKDNNTTREVTEDAAGENDPE